MPAYERDGVAEIAFASQKQYISGHRLRSATGSVASNRGSSRGCVLMRVGPRAESTIRLR
ncbi:hypothetical protein [Prescottella agglutinans]|uniref:hypothetical protein n=1 Tax=Prescottella agglutinans TaxID=1644129 RepID=UPI003D99B46B